MMKIYFLSFLMALCCFNWLSAQWLILDDTQILENFNDFTGSGFSATPSAGQLNSNAWIVTGLSDGDMTFGGDYASGDYARGISQGGSGTGGVYAFDKGASDYFIGFQPIGTDVTPGGLVLRLKNGSGKTITALDISYDLIVNNDQGRSSSFNFSHSLDDANYTAEPSLDFTSIEIQDANGFVSKSKSMVITGLTIENGDYYYLRWTTDDVGGSGSRDELGIDNVAISATLVGAITPDPEPSNHVLGFTAIANGAFQIDLSWTDNQGTNEATGYLIVANTTAVVAPTDGSEVTEDTDLSDGSSAVKVNAGVSSYSFTNLSPQTTYHFSIYPYANAGITIDYKTDGEVAAVSANTASLPYTTGDLVISEIMYNSPGLDEEWIEIFNASSSSIILDANWKLTNSTPAWEYTFDGAFTIASGDYMTIQVGSSGSFPFTADVVIYTTSNKLNNSSSTISLEYFGTSIDEVTYQVNEINLIDGDGKSLSLSDLSTANGDMTNWIASAQDGGTPGAQNDVTAWNGTEDNDFGNANNWTNGVPASNSAFIGANGNHAPVIVSDYGIAFLRLKSGVTLTISSGSLKVTSDIMLDGELDVSSGASLLPMASITGSGSAVIHRSTTFGTTDGKYSVVGSPVTDTETDVLGNIIYQYVASIAYGDDGGNRFSAVSATEVMSPGTAYFSANTGDITFIGVPNTGSVSVNMTYDETNDGGASNAGFNLISNPYTAAISYSAFMTANPDLNGDVFLWDDGGSNSGKRTNADYIHVTGLGATSGGSGRAVHFDNYLRSAQGFFVKATTSTSVVFTPEMMVTGHNSDAGFFRTSNTSENVIRLSLTNSLGDYNDLLIGLNDEASWGFDRMLDAQKMKGNDRLQFYSMIEELPYAILGLPFDPELRIDLGLDDQVGDELAITLEAGVMEGYDIYLKDRALNQSVDLGNSKRYVFNSTTGTNLIRFELLLKATSVLQTEAIHKKYVSISMVDQKLVIQVSAPMKNADVKIYSLSGKLVKAWSSVDLTTEKWETTFYDKGLFIVTVESNAGLFTKKLLN